MPLRRSAAGLGLSLAVALLAGCAVLAPTPKVPYLQHLSAGYTGCEPADNLISDATPAWGGTWHATCKDKVYVCTSDGRSASCAPRVQ